MFDTVRALTPDGPGRFLASADDSWFQGRGQYGGLTAAWLVEAATTVVCDPTRRLRSVTAHLTAPVPAGPVAIEATVLRAGAHVSHVQAILRAPDGGVCAAALATFGHARDGTDLPGPQAPDLPPPHALPALPDSPVLPAFARQHVAYHYGLGAPPWTGAPRARLGGWARFRRGATPDATMLVALSDVWPPAILPVLDRIRPAATVDLSVQLHGLPGPRASRDDLYAYDADIVASAEGYAEERATLWDAEGRLLLSVRQTIVVFG